MVIHRCCSKAAVRKRMPREDTQEHRKWVAAATLAVPAISAAAAVAEPRVCSVGICLHDQPGGMRRLATPQVTCGRDIGASVALARLAADFGRLERSKRPSLEAGLRASMPLL